MQSLAGPSKERAGDRQEASLTAAEVTELADLTGGHPETLYRFLDGSVGYLAPDVPYWQEVGESPALPWSGRSPSWGRVASPEGGRKQPGPEAGSGVIWSG